MQPYFIEIAPEGALVGFCARFNALLEKRGIIDGYPGNNTTHVFSQLGHQHPALTDDLSEVHVGKSTDLSLYPAGGKSFPIRWTLSPLSKTLDYE